MMSTPVNDGPNLGFSPSPIGSPDRLHVALDVSDFCPRRAARRVVYSSEEDITPPPEPTRTCLGVWVPRKVEINKYVDDNIQEEALTFENELQSEALRTNMRSPHRMYSAISSGGLRQKE